MYWNVLYFMFLMNCLSLYREGDEWVDGWVFWLLLRDLVNGGRREKSYEV